jgi:hypothetical protein
VPVRCGSFSVGKVGAAVAFKAWPSSFRRSKCGNICCRVPAGWCSAVCTAAGTFGLSVPAAKFHIPAPVPIAKCTLRPDRPQRTECPPVLLRPCLCSCKQQGLCRLSRRG